MKVEVLLPGVTDGDSVLDVGVVTDLGKADATRLIEAGYVEAVDEPEEPVTEPEVQEEPVDEPEKKPAAKRAAKAKE